ncbi:MAG: acyltransferase [Paludibacteraceae bacterium]|nr:acyltransferase [Paludibacteraceae bacterium]
MKKNISEILNSICRKIVNRSNYNFPFKKCGANLKVLGFPYYCWNKNVFLGDNVQIYPGVTFFGDGDVVIEDNVKIGNNVIINATNDGGGIRIGKGTIIAANSYIIDNNHGTKIGSSICEQKVEALPLQIGKYCWIAANCTVGKGTILGDGCVVAANSFVNKEFEANSIVGGSPARFIKLRS